jgi:hypothetical protein
MSNLNLELRGGCGAPVLRPPTRGVLLVLFLPMFDLSHSTMPDRSEALFAGQAEFVGTPNCLFDKKT